MGVSTSRMMRLHPARFRYKKDIDPSGLQQCGLVAEDVAKVYPDLVVYDDQGQPQTVRSPPSRRTSPSTKSTSAR